MGDEMIIQVSVTQVAVVETTDTPAGVVEHWCDHQGCKRWGAFGYSSRYGTAWFCGDHREDGEAMPQFARTRTT